MVIVDDASPDQTGYYIQRYMERNNVSSERVTLIRNQVQTTAVPNLHKAAMKYCRED